MDDIAPHLLEQIQLIFNKEVKSNQTIKSVLLKQSKKNVNYMDSFFYANELGECLKKAFSEAISEDVLPDRKMYFNIAQRLIEPMLKQNYDFISKQCEETQNIINEKAKIGLKAVIPDFNEEKAKGIIDYISNAETYSKKEKSFLDSLVTNSNSIVDDFVRENAEFHYQSGLSPKIVRTVASNCCKWCSQIAGTYDYFQVKKSGNVVFRRHANCKCTVVYDPGNNAKKVQDVWTKRNISKESTTKKQILNLEAQYFGKNVTALYYGTLIPKKGLIEYDESYKIAKHKEEIKVANFLFNEFGGNIKLLQESKEKGERMPDYLWNGKLWDLKTVTTEKSADSAIRKGLKQIANNSGGIILDYRGKNIQISKLMDIVDSRMKRGKYNTTDIMIILNDSIKIFRYKK